MASLPVNAAGQRPSWSAPLWSMASLPTMMVRIDERICSTVFLAMWAMPGKYETNSLPTAHRRNPKCKSSAPGSSVKRKADQKCKLSSNWSGMVTGCPSRILCSHSCDPWPSARITRTHVVRWNRSSRRQRHSHLPREFTGLLMSCSKRECLEALLKTGHAAISNFGECCRVKSQSKQLSISLAFFWPLRSNWTSPAVLSISLMQTSSSMKDCGLCGPPTSTEPL